MKMSKIFAASLAFVALGAPAMAASFESYDENADGNITKDEFYGSVADVGTYTDWDSNSDGLLDEDEFGGLESGWDYDAWDANDDNFVDSGEFYDGYYASYDADENGHWDNGEWDDAGEAGLFDW